MAEENGQEQSVDLSSLGSFDFAPSLPSQAASSCVFMFEIGMTISVKLLVSPLTVSVTV